MEEKVVAVILVGGPTKGTNFRPLSFNTPKPLFPIAGQAMVYHPLSACKTIPNLAQVFLIGFYEERDFALYVSSISMELKIPVRYLKEDKPRGSAGGIYYFRDLIMEDNPSHIFLLNFDVCCNFPLPEMLDAHKSYGGMGTLLVIRVCAESANQFGELVADPTTKEVLHYTEKPETFVSDLINCGVYVFTPEIFPAIESVYANREEKVSPSRRLSSSEAFQLANAFLEGKVKRIASDIKRTKEMLDTNNTSASKVIISDIQEKISGIEKAMSHVVGESDRSSGISRNMDTDSVQNIKADGEKILVKGQNSDELEARIFSHQKLLNVQSDQCQIVLPNCETWTAEKTVSYPINENPILFEYLASVNQPKFSLDFCNDLDVSEIEETKDGSGTPVQQDSNVLVEKHSAELQLTSDEHLEEFDEQENTPVMVVEGDNDENSTCQIRELGRKASTGGWFVSEGESVLLVHDDGSCSLHDAANSEVKSEYKPPSSIFSNIWSDCWIIRAPSSEGCSGKYVVAASAGNTLESGFCSWDYHTKEVQAFHIEEGTSNKRSILAPLQGRTVQRRNTLSTMMSTENRQWWYKPLGSLIVSTASFQKSVQIFDIRDGEGIMKWNVQKPVLNMDHSSPLQWRNSRKIVIAEADAITLWDVGSLTPQALLSIPASGHKISALYVNNTDAEGGGVRRRTSSSEAEGHDGVFCTVDSINILDFREPSGIGLKIPTLGVTAQSVFSRGDSVFLGCSSVRPPGKTNCSSQVQHFSLRRQKLVSTYVLPESNAHFHHTSLNQVWGNSDLVMGVSGQGLFVFDALRDEILPSFALDYCGPQKAREVIGSDDLYSPTFDYSSSQVLLISRDRPATFKYL